MTERCLSVAGWLLARIPESILRGLAVFFGLMIYAAAGRRRRVMLRNLAAVFPDRPAAWRRRIARESCARMVETGLLALASPQFSLERVRRMAVPDPDLVALIRTRAEHPRALVFGSAHLAGWEALTWLPALVSDPFLEPATIFRPLRNPRLNDWIVRTRERFGVKLLSRKTGIHTAMHILARHGAVNVLFDQNAGGHGTLTTFFGRNISMTELPALLVTKTGADLKFLGTRRTGFWRMQLFVREAPHDGTVAGIMAALNLAFEQLLREDEELCASWLWLHDRWKISELPVEFRKISAKRNLLAEDARFRASRGTN